MLKIWDFQCVDCKQIFEDMYDTSNYNESYCPDCPVCKGKTEKIISEVRFKLLYNPKKDLCDWSGGGYATSQYWKDVNAAKDRGEDVAGAGSVIYDEVAATNRK